MDPTIIGSIAQALLGGGAAIMDARERQRMRQLIESIGRQGVGFAQQGIEDQYIGLDQIIANAVQQNLMANAGRVDAYGNRTQYDPTTNMWENVLSPRSQALLDLSQDEQFRNFKEDAPLARQNRQLSYDQNRNIVDANRDVIAGNTRTAQLNNAIQNSIRDVLGENQNAIRFNRDVLDTNRQGLEQTRNIYDANAEAIARNRNLGRDNERIRGQLQDRGEAALQDYGDIYNEQQFTAPPSFESINDEISRLMARSRGMGERATETLADRAAVRRMSNTPVVVTGGASGNEGVGAKVANQALQARQAALAEYGTRQQQHQSKYSGLLQQLQSQFGLGRGTPEQLTGPSAMTGTQSLSGSPINPQGLNSLMSTAPLANIDDRTGSLASGINSQQSGMADAIAKALQNEAGNVGTAYGRIGTGYGNLTNANNALIAGLSRSMPGNENANIAKGFGGILGSIGKIFTGGSGANGVKGGQDEFLFGGSY